jgi:hypothetical protein
LWLSLLLMSFLLSLLPFLLMRCWTCHCCYVITQTTLVPPLYVLPLCFIRFIAENHVALLNIDLNCVLSRLMCFVSHCLFAFSINLCFSILCQLL